MRRILTYDEYLNESAGNNSDIGGEYMKLSKKDKEYLIGLDREYGKLSLLFRSTYRAKNVLNTDEEFKRFMDARREGKKYFPKLDIEREDSDVDIEGGLRKLLKSFENFDSYISRFYIDKIEGFLTSIKHHREHIEKSKDGGRQEKPENPYDRGGSFPTRDEYEYALRVMSENPYEKVKAGVRNIGPEQAKKRFQKYIDRLGYDFTVEIVDGMLPRVNVTPNGVVRVSSEAHFSNDDIEGLCQHEIEGHVGRRYFGYRTGLYLFVSGLTEANTYDEGLAIWNSLNRVKTPKPNILFNIALKTVITYHLYDMDFCEIFDFVKELCPKLGDKTVFKSIVRMKRGVGDCSLYGGALESGYFKGYTYVQTMDDRGRDDILKYNIGPGQFEELDKIKKFLEVNKFDPIPVPKGGKVGVNESFGDSVKVTDETVREVVEGEIRRYGRFADLNHIDVGAVTDMSTLFYGTDFNGDISGWDVSNVRNMYSMFKESSFNGDISKWDTSNVTDMSYMFEKSSFNGDISGWDVSKVEYMSGMFKDSVFNGDISSWNTGSCVFLNYTFFGSSFNGDLSEWDVSKVRHLTNTFEKSVFDGDISKWDVSSVENMRCCFKDSSFSGDLSAWRPKSLKKMQDCFTNSNADTTDIKWIIAE